MLKVDAIKMTKTELAEMLAAKESKNPASRIEWAKAYARRPKAYLVALLVEKTTRKNSKAYAAAKADLTAVARKIR